MGRFAVDGDDPIVVLGLAVGGLGVALAGLAIPAVSRKLHVEPVAAH